MYLNILKKDLKRKKAMNIILLLFIILATMFVASSVNNIINVTTALDNYFEMANAPDYMIMTMDKALTADVDKAISSAPSVERCGSEKIIFLTADHMSFEDEGITAVNGTNIGAYAADGLIVATIMALDRAVRNQGNNSSVYDERGIIYF